MGDDYVMVFGSRQELYSVQSCSSKDQGVSAPVWNQDPNGEDATCFTKAQPATPAPTPAPAVSFVETPMKRSAAPRCTGGLTIYQDVWQCLIIHKDDSTGAQVAKAACSNLTACVAVYTRPSSDDYVMVFGSRQELYSVQSCSSKDQGVSAPVWNQDPNGEDATCFTKAMPATPAPTPAPKPAPAVSFVETPMKRSCYPNCVCTGGLTMYQDVWQCLITHKDDSTGAQVAKAACSNLTACVAVYTRPGVDDYVMVFGSRQELYNVQSCSSKDQ